MRPKRLLKVTYSAPKFKDFGVKSVGYRVEGQGALSEKAY